MVELAESETERKCWALPYICTGSVSLPISKHGPVSVDQAFPLSIPLYAVRGREGLLPFVSLGRHWPISSGAMVLSNSSAVLNSSVSSSTWQKRDFVDANLSRSAMVSGGTLLENDQGWARAGF